MLIPTLWFCYGDVWTVKMSTHVNVSSKRSLWFLATMFDSSSGTCWSQHQSFGQAHPLEIIFKIRVNIILKLITNRNVLYDLWFHFRTPFDSNTNDVAKEMFKTSHRRRMWIYARVQTGICKLLMRVHKMLYLMLEAFWAAAVKQANRSC